jgi:ATP-binding cassette, subfamily B, bacterial
VRKADLAIDGFPDGHDTMLSREFDGMDLSGGEWQRVGRARGFFRAHDLIVLDEPTAAILVTHRLGSTKTADRIVVMDAGKIVELGTHEELILLGGTYATMFTAQARWYA